MKRLILCAGLLAAMTASAQRKTIPQKVDSVLKLMTLEEKVGQMNQYNGPWAATGPLTNDDNLLSQIKEGKVGSMNLFIYVRMVSGDDSESDDQTRSNKASALKTWLG